MVIRAIVQSIILIAVLTGVVFWLVPFTDSFRDILFLAKYKETGRWQTYTSQTFGFQVEVPSDWIIVEFPNDQVAPRVNMYPPKTKVVQPLTHHSEIAHVSVFPKGIPTEGFFGETVSSDIIFSQDVKIANDFILEDGSRFATFVAFSEVGKNGNEAGFVWSRIHIKRMRTLCFRGEVQLKESECDPFTGDTVVHEGVIDFQEREIHKTILSSFKFIHE